MDSPNASDGFLRAHGVAFALVAIFVGVALAVAYAASDGAIFGRDSSATPAGSRPVNDSSTGGAAVISRDSFDVADSAPFQPNVTSAPTESNTTMSEEQRRLLAMRHFPWDSVVGGHIASSQGSMDRFRQPVPAGPEVESLALSDRVLVNVDRGREDVENDDRDLADVIDDIIDIEIPVEVENNEEQAEEQPPEVDEQEEPPQDEDQGSDSGNGNQTDDDDSSGEGSDDEESEDDQSGSGGGGGNSTRSGLSGNSENGDGNSTRSEDLPEDN